MTLRLNKATVAQLATELASEFKGDGPDLTPAARFAIAFDMGSEDEVEDATRALAEAAVTFVIGKLVRTGLVVVVEEGENAAQVTDPKVVSGFVTGFLDAPSTASPRRRDYLTSFHLEQEHLFPDVQDDEGHHDG